MSEEPFRDCLKVVFTGTDERPYGNTMSRCRWFQKLGHDVFFVPIGVPDSGRWNPWGRLQARWAWEPSLVRVNRDLIKACLAQRPSLVWVDKGYTIFPRTVETIKRLTGAILVSHVNDTPFTMRRNERFLWRQFKAAIPLYDVHLVSQGFQIQEFIHAGARRVFRFMHGLDPDVHRPQPSSPAESETKGALIFIGNCEPDRVPLAEALVRTFNSRFQVYGPNWDRFATRYLKTSGSLHPPIYLEAYAAAIGEASVSIGLLSKTNQDQITRRSYEIPGCGGCLLAERTADHERLLREGKEAFFWSDVEELVEKAKFLLEHDEVVQRVKVAAYQRSRELGFGYDQRIPRWLGFVFGERKTGDELLESTVAEG